MLEQEFADAWYTEWVPRALICMVGFELTSAFSAIANRVDVNSSTYYQYTQGICRSRLEPRSR